MTEHCKNELPEYSETITLAEEYAKSSRSLFEAMRSNSPHSLAPARLCAIHAIELYLNALLRHDGLSSDEIRGAYMHDLAKRVEHAAVENLRLRRKTLAHLRTISANREYLTARYPAENGSECSQINRMLATLSEVTSKVRKQIDLP